MWTYIHMLHNQNTVAYTYPLFYYLEMFLSCEFLLSSAVEWKVMSIVQYNPNIRKALYTITNARKHRTDVVFNFLSYVANAQLYICRTIFHWHTDRFLVIFILKNQIKFERKSSTLHLCSACLTAKLAVKGQNLGSRQVNALRAKAK